MNPNKIQQLQLAPDIGRQLKEQALQALPEECCGILAGHLAGGRMHIRQLVRLVNVAQQERMANFAVADADLIKAARLLRQQGLELLGFYHSHPFGLPAPSRKDVASCSGWDGYSHIIVATDGRDRTQIAAFITQRPMWKRIQIQGAES